MLSRRNGILAYVVSLFFLMPLIVFMAFVLIDWTFNT
jgi:hypothetical protein